MREIKTNGTENENINAKFNVPGKVLKNIVRFAEKCEVEKVLLFGSRAKGTHTSVSDIDIAVLGGDFDSFYWMIQEQKFTLLMFDVVNLNEEISDELTCEIEQYGVVLYEKT